MRTPDFNKPVDGLLPAIIQDANTGKVLMLGYMNKEAYEKSLADKRVCFYSRSKQRLWVKGETSNNFLHIVDVLVDCDEDTILIKANPAGPVCHTGTDTCFDETNRPDFLRYLEQIIQQRKNKPSDKSYTSSLFAKGMNKIAQKVGEEAVETVIEALNQNNQELFLGESADLLYHYLILLAARETSLDEVVKVLESRHK